jgi:hypothetical protein
MNNTEEKSNVPEIGEYKGRPVITLNPGERYPFTFGLAKAKLILQHIDDIRVFVEKYDK